MSALSGLITIAVFGKTELATSPNPTFFAILILIVFIFSISVLFSFNSSKLSDPFKPKSVALKITIGTAQSIRVNLIIEENSESETLSIERRWAENENGKIKEKVLILRNGEEDKSLLDNWFQYIENLLPLSTMPLFFFDGEKLEDLANPDKSSGIIRSAVDGLLGLDLIDQCKSDLDIFISKKAKDVFDKETLKEIKVKEDSIKEVQDKFPYLNNQMQKIEEQIDIITSDIESYKLEFKKKGGEVYQAKEK